MSVFVKITTPGGAVYRLSDGPAEHSGFSWRPILKNTVSIERAARATENGIPTTAQTLNVWNADRYIECLDASLNDALTDSAVEIEVAGIQGGWNGVIKAWEQADGGLLSIRAGQDALAVFKRQVPDETVRLVTFADASREAVNTTIPTVIGGTTNDPVPVPGILIDRAAFVWAFAVGKCRSFTRVMSDRKAVTTGFTTYLGTADQAIWPGLACVKFDADPRDSNGAWPEISAEMVGLEIGSTEAEGRNPARVIRAYLTTADTGACGWGLGESADSIDTESVDQAILDCDTLGLHLDGMMSQTALSGYWLSQMCLGGRLRLDKPAGKWQLRVDMATDSVKEYDANNILSYSFWPGDSSLRHKKARVEYRADFITKQFLGSATRTIGTIGDEENLLEQHLVRDHTTGNATADYVANVEKYGELRMQIRTDDVWVGQRTLEEDDVVTIRVPEFPAGRLFRVTALSHGTDESKVELRSYDDAIFDLSTPSTTSDPALDPIVRASPLPEPPMSPSGVSLVTDSRIQADGTLLVWIDGTYTADTGFLVTRVEFGEGANPTVWNELGTTTNGKWHHEPVKPGQVYTYRLTSINTGGESTSATASIQAANDTTAPGIPQMPLLKALFKSITIECLQNLTKAADLAGFEVWRNTTNNVGTATNIGFQPCPGSADGATYLDDQTDYSTTYYYWLKAKDHTGNASGFSAVAGPVTTLGIIAGDLAAGALNSSSLFAAGVVDAAALADAAVTAAKTSIAAIDPNSGNLAVGSVTTGSLAAGAITSEKIISTGITGACICAGTITTSKLLISSPGAALNEDPAFADSTAWVRCAGSIYFCTVTDGKSGNTVIRTYSAGCAGWPFSSKLIPVDPSKTYRVRVWVRKSATANGTFYLSWRTYNSSGTGIPENYGYYICFGVSPATTWTEYSVLVGYGTSWAATSDARTMNIGMGLNYGGTAGYMEAQDFRIEEVLPATLIQDGAITTEKIIATGISGACICAGSITTAHLSASGICADCVKAGTLTGVSICATVGNIGGWTICTGYMYASSACGAVYIQNTSSNPVIITQAGSACGGCGSYATHGRMYWNSAYQNAYGFGVSATSTGSLSAGMGIAMTGGITLPDSSTVAAGCPFFWVGESGSYVKYYDGTLSITGDIEVSSSGNILPDPDFWGVPYAADCVALACGTVIGEWTVANLGTGSCTYTSHKSTATRCAYRHPGSNALWMYGNSSANYVRLNGNLFPITPGGQYIYSMYVASHPGYACPRLLACMYFYNAAGTCVGACGMFDTTDIPQSATRICKAVSVPATAVRGFVNLYNYATSGGSFLYVSGLQLEEKYTSSQTVPSQWKPRSGAITANRIVGGKLLSVNWKSDSGSCLDLSAGTFYLGGSSAPKLSWDGTALVVCGTVCATAGCFSGTITSCSGTIGGWTLCNGYLWACRYLAGNVSLRGYLTSVSANPVAWFTIKDGLYAEVCSAGIGFLCSSNQTGYVMASSLCGSGNRPLYADANGWITLSSSDCRLKTNIIPLFKTICVERSIAAITGVYFNWRQDIEPARRLGTQREIGLIAQEVQKVVPEAVGANNDGYLSLDYSRLVPLLIEAQKESYSRIKALEDRLCNIETRLAAA